VLRAAGETETLRGNIQDWLQLGEGNSGYHLLTEQEIAAVIFLFIFISTACIIKFSFYLFSNVFCFPFSATSCFINPK
jgi:hypothetical protein